MAACKRLSDFEPTNSDPVTTSFLTKNKETHIDQADSTNTNGVQEKKKNSSSKTKVYNQHLTSILIACVAILCIVLIGLVAFIFSERMHSKFTSMSDNDDEDAHKCVTNTCYKASNFMMDNAAAGSLTLTRRRINSQSPTRKCCSSFRTY